MKLTSIPIIAAALAGSIAVSAPASAQDRHVEVTRTTVVHRGYTAHRRHKVCTVNWVHHRKIRRCVWR